MPTSTLASTLFPMPAVYQIAYVTTDLEQALALYRERCGMGEFGRFDNIEVSTSGERAARISVGLAFVGETQIELIEPRGGDDRVYREILPASGFASRLHHLGYLVPNQQHWQALLDELNRQGIGIPMRHDYPNAQIMYTDRRDDLGHYVEYFLFSEAGLARQALLPHYR